MLQDQIIVGIDVGTTKICTLIADVAGEAPEVLGVGICLSQGLRKGVVVDLESAAKGIATSLRRAEQQSGFKAISAFVGIAGSHIVSFTSRAGAAVRGPGGAISVEDVAQVMEAARVVQLPPDQEILHVIPRRFVVDGVGDIRQPVGMTGRQLEVEACIVAGSATPIQNLARCVESVGVQLDALVLHPLAAGHAVLSAAERDLGTLVIDMGGGTTDAAVFRDGSLWHTHILPVGGHQVSNDLAFCLRAPLAVAEELKVRYGSTLCRAQPEGEAIPVSGDGIGQWIEQRTLAEVIDARLAETFELVHAELARQGFGDSYPAGVVLTGGSAQIPGAPELASQTFGVPARLGVPLPASGLAEAVRGPAFSAGVGLLFWGGQQLRAASALGGGGRIARARAALSAWLRNFLG